MHEITPAQKKFIKRLLNREIVVRSPYSVVANNLHRMGLVKFAFGVGWYLTRAGIEEASKNDNY